MKIVFSKKLLIPISIIIFPVCNLVGGITDYYDEIIGLIAVIYCVYSVCSIIKQFELCIILQSQ